MNALVPVLGAILGALLYAVAPPALSELGRVLFMASVFALMFALAGHSIRVF